MKKTLLILGIIIALIAAFIKWLVGINEEEMQNKNAGKKTNGSATKETVNGQTEEAKAEDTVENH